MEGGNSNPFGAQPTNTSDRIKLNVGGKLFETTTSTLRSGGPDSLLSVLSNRPVQQRDHSQPVFIDRDPDIFSALLFLLRSNRLPSTARRFSNQELIDEAIYYGIESQLRSALAPPPLSGIDASVFTTIRPASDAIVSDFNAIDSDGSVWVAHGGQISVYDWNLTHSATVRTHLDYINYIRMIRPGIAAVASETRAGLHLFNVANGYRVGSVEWLDPGDPRIFKARVHAIGDSEDSVFASFDCQHKENCVLMIDKSTAKVVSEITRQSGNSSKAMVAGKLTYVPRNGLLIGASVMSGAFGYSGYIRLWDPRSRAVVWETNEPGSGRSSRFGDSFADVDVDLEELTLVKLCSKSGDLAVADLRKLSDDPWVYLKEKNPSMRQKPNDGGSCVIHCYRKQVFVGREGELEVWSIADEEEEKGSSSDDNVRVEERVLSEGSFRRNFVDKVADSERGVISKIEGGGDRLFLTREGAEGIEILSDFGLWAFLKLATYHPPIICYSTQPFLAWADILTGYALWTLMIYLTEVWKLTFTHAAGILNVYCGLMGIMPLIMQVIVDTLVGNYWMLLLSSFVYCVGMVFLTMSTPPILSKFTGTCSSYEPECVGDTQQGLFYSALALIAVGTAGHIVSLVGFLGEQLEDAIENVTTRSILTAYAGNVATFAVSAFAVLGFPYIKPWSLHFGIPAIFILVATLVFLSGSSTYTYVRPQGSHLTMVIRVLVASASKLFHQLPADAIELHGMSDLAIPRTRGLRCLNKAAIVIPNQSVEESPNNRWKLCTVTEIEATKLIISLIPMSISFIFIGLISSLGLTFFVEQARRMNHKVGSLTVPLPIFWWFYVQGKTYFPQLYFGVSNLLCWRDAQTVAPVVGQMVSMLLGLLCCVTAAKVESHRLGVVKSHGLLDKPDERIPMSVFWLLPQFVLLGGTDGMFEISVASFNANYFTPSLNKYMLQIGCIWNSLGFLGSILAVQVLRKVTESGEKPSWFQDTINLSRLDNYYWFLSCLCAINLVWYVVLRCCYACRSRDAEEQGQNASQESDCCCCFC